MRLYIIRHADPDYENNTITQQGHKEAAALAKRLASHGLDRIHSSPQGRAVDTMKYSADLLNMEFTIEDWTKELYAELSIEGTPWGKIFAIDTPGEIIRGGKIIPTQETWHSIEYIREIKAKQTFERVKENSDSFLKRHGYEREGGRYRIVKSNEEKIAIFCHFGFGLTWLAHLLEIPAPIMWSGFWLPPSSVTTILFEERSPDWAVPRCIGVGDVSHLYEAGLPVQPRGIAANFH